MRNLETIRMKLINIYFFILISIQLESQEVVTWNLKDNTLNKPLIPDIPFQLKISRIDALKYCIEARKFEIWDRGNEKEVEELLVAAKEDPYPISLKQKYLHPKSRRWNSDVLTTDSFDYFVNIPNILKTNTIYYLELTCDSKISDLEFAEVKTIFEKDEVLENILHPFFEELNNKYNDYIDSKKSYTKEIESVQIAKNQKKEFKGG